MKVRFPDLEPNPVNDAHQEIGIPPVENAITHPGLHPFLRLASWFISLVMMTLILVLLGRLFLPGNWQGGIEAIRLTLLDSAFWSGVAVGFAAQVVDGSLGMAYGVTATAFLLGTGVSPAVASGSVHIAEVFTTGFSGLSHLRFGNVNRDLFVRLLLPGIAGSILGAVLVTQIDGAIFKPIVSAYLVMMGCYILYKACRHRPGNRPGRYRHVAKLAVFGGFVDSAGGGGWGPVVTTSLLSSGNDPRTVIGSVNFAEFFLTLTSAAVFALLVGPSTWPTVAGLILGGLFAAPFAAVLCSRIPARTLLFIVGVVITLLSLYNFYSAII